MTKPKTVFVGLSGGVDSSVAALRLQKQGYNVVGVFIKVWQPDFLECNWEQERLDAMRVAAKLNIPFLTCDAEQAYKDGVADYFISEYQAGRTPNPDVMCNQQVKFGAFLEFAQAKGADFVATGHYAQKVTTASGDMLKRGVDTDKDQSYFLWTLSQEQLKHILLPVGNSQKSSIRQEAEAANLITADKKDSQGICFLGQVDIPEFLSHYIDLQPGSVLNESGQTIGAHHGALVYTIGQRHGFEITNTSEASIPHYVTARDIDNNSITVAPEKPNLKQGSKLQLSDCNFINYEPKVGEVVEAQTRYRQQPSEYTIVSVSDNGIILEPSTDTESVSAGQSCVLYRGDQCLGGGIIAS